ncbi:MAG: NADH:ubiquinone oxidoreductase subunit NDUFA12 [Pseudomonadota bacterium]|nr:NADH:ubiquinone oxidoreductase subunit NDUFA12 [Pseudomonadota bacterium]
MGLFANAFTWWNGASWGTSILSRRHGKEVGRDEAGNIYFEHRKTPERRWVIYSGSNDSSRVPPGWNAWLRGTISELPETGLPQRRAFEQPAQPNATGTTDAYRPSGSMNSLGVRPAATGDYQAWKPE